MNPLKLKQTSSGHCAKQSDVHQFIGCDMEAGNYLPRQVAKNVTPDYELCAETLQVASDYFDRNLATFMVRMTTLKDGAHKASGDIRKAADSLSSGLQKIEKQANFDRLERYVLLIERAATAMVTLSELEKNGKLDKIVSALK